MGLFCLVVGEVKEAQALSPFVGKAGTFVLGLPSKEVVTGLAFGALNGFGAVMSFGSTMAAVFAFLRARARGEYD